jgi:hypothetical protein
MFPVLVFASHFEILLVRKPRHPTRMFHHSSCSSVPIDFICVQYTVCVHTQNDIWMPETEISGYYMSVLPLCTACVMLWRCFMHSPHIHRSCLTLLDVTSGGRYGWIWLTFWTFIIQRWYIPYWDFHVNLSLNNLCLLKEEITPVAMSTNSFPEIVISLVSELLFLV